MLQIVAYVLWCSTATPYDQCDQQTALDVHMIEVSQVACGIAAQQFQAMLGAADQRYLKVQCGARR